MKKKNLRKSNQNINQPSFKKGLQNNNSLPLIVNTKSLSTRNRNTSEIKFADHYTALPLSLNNNLNNTNKKLHSQKVITSTFKDNNNYKNGRKEMLPAKSKTLLYFSQELKKLEEEMARLREKQEEEIMREQQENLGSVDMTMGSSLPYTPNFACQLDKRQRFEIYKRRLNAKKAATSVEEAVKLINKTIDEVEDRYAPKKEDKVYPIYSKKYGRMFRIPKERIRFNEETGLTEMLTVGLIIYVRPNGAFEIWTVPRGNFDSKRIYAKIGAVKKHE
jgi:hypothetical protein